MFDKDEEIALLKLRIVYLEQQGEQKQLELVLPEGLYTKEADYFKIAKDRWNDGDVKNFLLLHLLLLALQESLVDAITKGNNYWNGPIIQLEKLRSLEGKIEPERLAAIRKSYVFTLNILEIVGSVIAAGFDGVYDLDRFEQEITQLLSDLQEVERTGKSLCQVVEERYG